MLDGCLLALIQRNYSKQIWYKWSQTSRYLPYYHAINRFLEMWNFIVSTDSNQTRLLFYRNPLNVHHVSFNTQIVNHNFPSISDKFKRSRISWTTFFQRWENSQHPWIDRFSRWSILFTWGIRKHPPSLALCIQTRPPAIVTHSE